MSSDAALREALAARLSPSPEAGVSRASLSIGTEQVTLWVRSGQLRESCTCGGEGCDHVRAAIAFLVGDASALLGETPLRGISLRPLVVPVAEVSALAPLADALDELCLATVRAGLGSPDAPALKQALEQLTRSAPQPPSAALGRWLGRFRGAVAAGDIGEVARLLEGARRFADALRSPGMQAADVELRRAWLGAVEPGGVTALADATLLELGREWVAGPERAALERRYLVDLADGELYVEQRARSDAEGSVGPCPRLVHVAYADVELGHRPRRVRLLQYTVAIPEGETAFQRLVPLAVGDVAALRGLYTAAQAECPGLAEPVALFAPSELEPGSDGTLCDAKGERVWLDDEQGGPGADSLRAAVGSADLVCVLGRLLGRAAGLTLRPLSVLVRRGAWLELHRVT